MLRWISRRVSSEIFSPAATDKEQILLLLGQARRQRMALSKISGSSRAISGTCLGQCWYACGSARPARLNQQARLTICKLGAVFMICRRRHLNKGLVIPSCSQQFPDWTVPDSTHLATSNRAASLDTWYYNKTFNLRSPICNSTTSSR